METFTWEEKRPGNGQKIQFYESRRDMWHDGIYFDDGIDGVVSWMDGDEWEVEEYGQSLFPKWRMV